MRSQPCHPLTHARPPGNPLPIYRASPVHYEGMVSSAPAVARLSPGAAGRASRRQVVVLGCAGVAAVAFSGWMIHIGARGYPQRAWSYWLATPVGLSFIAAGLIAWWRWPANRIGALMVAGGAAW